MVFELFLANSFYFFLKKRTAYNCHKMFILLHYCMDYVGLRYAHLNLWQTSFVVVI